MSFKVVEEIKAPRIKLMSEMQPGEIGKIIAVHNNSKVCNRFGNCIDHIVMRTANVDSFEVMNLTEFDSMKYCWQKNNFPEDIEVELLPIGTKITLEIT